MERLIQIQRHLWICICLAIFNIADALFTHQVLLQGGKELNPIMALLYNKDPALFLFVKFIFSYLILAIGFVSLSKRVQFLLVIAFTIYSIVLFWHLLIQICI
jgi:Domain of unknown function (DUF5658)